MYRTASLLTAYATAIQLSVEQAPTSTCVSTTTKPKVDCSKWPAAMMPTADNDTLNASDFTHEKVIIWMHGAGGAPSSYQ